MNKRNITKLEKLVEKLKTATPRNAYHLFKCVQLSIADAIIQR